MLTANKLEKIMELESNLRDQYQGQLDAKQAEIDTLTAKQAELQKTIETQLASIKDLSVKATANDRVEQLNRELNNRSEKQQAELAEMKKRVKTLQKDLAEVRTENKALTQFDGARMKKNLDATKKKLVEKTKANELIQKSLKDARQETLELKQQVAELEAKLAEGDTAETPAESEAA